jgi:phosphoglycerol transferase MdoB-like AlkP superfamily enzyme
MNRTNETNSGIGLAGVLFVVFLVLKLTKVIDWSWWWVTAPLWIPTAFALVILLFFALFMWIANRN